MSLRAILEKINKQQKQSNLSKTNREVSDILLSVVITIAVLLVAHWLLVKLLSIHPFFVDHSADFIGTLVAIYFLNTKYPLQFLPGLNFRNALKYVLPAVFLYMLFGGFPYFLYFGHSELLPEIYNLFVEFNTSEKIFLLVFACLIGPITEETFYRGYIYRIIKNRYNIYLGTVVSTGMFYIFHSSHRVEVIISSLIFTCVYEKTGNIWSSMLVHSLSNTLWFVFVYWGLKL